MCYNLSVDVVGYLLDDPNGDSLDEVSIQLGERSQDLIWTEHKVSRIKLLRKDLDIPWRLQDLGSHYRKLCHNAQNVQVRPVCEQEIP